MRKLLLILTAIVALSFVPLVNSSAAGITSPLKAQHQHHHHKHHKPWWLRSPKAYAHHIVMHRWPGQFDSENNIVQQESHWDPCAVNPVQHLCTYTWSGNGNACGIAQRYYCPTRWYGKLGAMWKDQVRDLENYIAVRYGNPDAAWAYKQAHGTY